MKSRRYFQLVERESSEVSLKWKALHAVLFIAIAVNSIIASYAISNLLNAFNCRCILYAEPIFIIDNIGFINNTYILESKTEAIIETTTDLTVTEFLGETTTEVHEIKSFSKNIESDPHSEIIFSKSKRDNNGTFKQRTWNFIKNISENYYISNNTILFKNDSMYGEITVKLTKTNSPYVVMCDYVHFLPLLSLILASSFTAIVIIYGRGGRGYPGDTIQQGWRYVYFTLIISSLLFILFLVATNLINSGTQRFCSYFSTYTGKNRCNNYINYFALRTKLDHAHFYADYLFAYSTYIINTCLWTAQLLLLIWRMLSCADFQFYSISVEVKNKEVDGNVPVDNEEADEKQFQKIHQVLKKKELGTREYPDIPDEEEKEERDEDCDQNTESTARM